MTQTIDPVKLKAAAEHLEWTLKQYPDSGEVRDLLRALLPLIEDVRSGKILDPVDSIPCGYNFADGAYMRYRNPDVGEAYSDFLTEMRGGLTEQDKKALARMQAVRDGIKAND